MNDIDKIFEDWNEEEWNNTEDLFGELKEEIKSSIYDNTFSFYLETVDGVNDICETYKKYNVISDYDVKWDSNNTIDVYIHPCNKMDSVIMSISVTPTSSN